MPSRCAKNHGNRTISRNRVFSLGKMWCAVVFHPHNRLFSGRNVRPREPPFWRTTAKSRSSARGRLFCWLLAQRPPNRAAKRKRQQCATCRQGCQCYPSHQTRVTRWGLICRCEAKQVRQALLFRLMRNEGRGSIDRIIPCLRMIFIATIYDKHRQPIETAEFPTWPEAAFWLSKNRHTLRHGSGIRISTPDFQIL